MPGESALLRTIAVIQSWKEQLIVLHSLLSGPVLLILFFFLGMLCSADWKGRQRFNSTVKNIGKSHHCNCLKRVISQFLSTSTLVHCPVVYPTMYMHQAPADSRKSMSAVNSTDCSFSCLLAALVSYVFDSE